jgi:ABC-2 type transport system permease protein
VADLSIPASLFDQIRLVAWLRWRLLRNNLRKKNNRLDLIGLIFAGIFGGILVVGLSIAFYAGAYSFVSTGKVSWMGLLFWAIFLWWQLFPIFVAGFGANFEFRALLRFPLSPSVFYLIGLAYGLADFSAVAVLCWLGALTLGVAVAQPAALPAMLLVVALFVVLNVTLERLLGSWMERLLARRRSRELFFALFILLSVSAQFIGPAIQRYGSVLRPLTQKLLPYLVIFPGSLAGRAIAGAISLHLREFFLGIAGLIAYVIVLSASLWIRFSSQYRGEELGESAAPVHKIARSSSNTGGDTETLRLLSPQVAAVVRKEIRYVTRNGFAALLLLLPPAMVLLFSTQFAGKHPTVGGKGVSPDMFFPGIMAYLILMLMAPAYNAFAYEGRGVQTYFTAPLKFRDVLLGKNLVQISILTFEILLCTIVLSVRIGLPATPVFVATLTALVFVVVGQLSIANWSSLSFPRKLEFGQMRGQRQSGMAVLVAFGVQIVFGSASGLILFMGRWTGNPWLPAEAFAALSAAAMAGYFASLDALSTFAEKKKESLIEALCR